MSGMRDLPPDLRAGIDQGVADMQDWLRTCILMLQGMTAQDGPDQALATMTTWLCDSAEARAMISDLAQEPAIAHAFLLAVALQACASGTLP